MPVNCLQLTCTKILFLPKKQNYSSWPRKQNSSSWTRKQNSSSWPRKQNSSSWPIRWGIDAIYPPTPVSVFLLTPEQLWSIEYHLLGLCSYTDKVIDAVIMQVFYWMKLLCTLSRRLSYSCIIIGISLHTFPYVKMIPSGRGIPRDSNSSVLLIPIFIDMV